MTKHVLIALVAAAGLTACGSGDKQTRTTRRETTTERPVTQTATARDMRQGWVPGQPPSATTSTTLAGAEAMVGRTAQPTFTVQPAARSAMAAPAPIGGDAFVRTGLAGDMFEVESSQLALDRASDERVRQFAQMMIDDHTAAFEQLAQAADVQGIALPEGPIPRQLAMLDRLSTLQGDQFDLEYIQAQVDAHQNAVQIHELFIRTGRNPQLQALAEQRLPIIRDHLEQARMLAEVLDPTAQVGNQQQNADQPRQFGRQQRPSGQNATQQTPLRQPRSNQSGDESEPR